MVSPVREKRAWPPRDKDADAAETVAAFEATVAEVKQTVVRSGEVLISANEDLSDHKRWLEIQSAAVQADRARHDRWLQRQHERQEALERREQAKRRRQLMRQRAVRAVKDAVSAVVLFVRSAIWFAVAKTIAALNYVDELEARSLKWVGSRLRDVALYVARGVQFGLLWADRKAWALALSVGHLLSARFSWIAAKAYALARSIGGLLSAGFSSSAAKTHELARATGRLSSAGFSSSAAKTHELAHATGKLSSSAFLWSAAKTNTLARSIGRSSSAGLSGISAMVRTLAPPTGRFLSICFAGIAARLHDLTRSIGRLLAAGFSSISANARVLARSTGIALAPAFAWISAKAYAIAPSLSAQIAKAGLYAGHYAREGAGRAERLLAAAAARARRAETAPAETPRAETPRAETAPAETPRAETAPAETAPAETAPAETALAEAENEVSSPQRIEGFALSQMLIIAGTLFLVCGGLMLGGGLILRAGTPAPIVSSDTVVWFFEYKELPIAKRSVFAFAETPAGVRIQGFSISAENRSDQPLTSVAGVIQPDGERSELKLAVSIDMPGGEASVVHPPEAHLAEPLANGVVPPHTLFKLVFPFPAEAENGQHGVTAEEVLATFGGLMLKVHYEAEGKQKAFMRYLSPSMLKDQLAEIQTEPNGSKAQF